MKEPLPYPTRVSLTQKGCHAGVSPGEGGQAPHAPVSRGLNPAGIVTLRGELPCLACRRNPTNRAASGSPVSGAALAPLLVLAFGVLSLLGRQGGPLGHAFHQRVAAFPELTGVCPQGRRLATDSIVFGTNFAGEAQERYGYTGGAFSTIVPLG